MAKIKNPLTIVGTAGGGSSDDYNIDGLVDGTLTTFTMPAGKTTVAPYRCYNFTSLTTVDLTGIETIGDYAFDGCTSVSQFIIPSTITKIGDYAFRNLGTNGDSTFVFDCQNAKTAIGDYAFMNTSLTVLSGNFSTIGDASFSTCKSLTSVEITADSIGGYAFNSCTALTDININCGNIGAYAFYGLAATSITAKINGSIGDHAFSDLRNVADVNISPDSKIIHN